MFNAFSLSRNQRRQLKKSSGAGRPRFGTATVEMAFVAPVILLLVFGSIEFARMMMVRQALTNASREGCRKACLASTESDEQPIKTLRESLRGVIDDATTTEDLRITIVPSTTTAMASGTKITTVVEIDCENVSWLPPFLTKGAKIRCTSSMNRE